jgi:hypothetical protein
MTFLSIDPGSPSGIAVFAMIPFGQFVTVGTVKDDGKITDYMNNLELIRIRHDVTLALIEDYVNFGNHFVNASKVQAHIRACKDTFPCHIMIKNSQWNPRDRRGRMQGDKVKREMANTDLHLDRVFHNDHTTDAALMGRKFIVTVQGYAQWARMGDQDCAMLIANQWGRMPKRGEFSALINERREEKRPVFSEMVI